MWGPTSVNYSVSAVTTAIDAVDSLSTSLGGLSGTNISFNNSNQTVNESSGTLQTSNGVSYRVFNVTSYSETNSDTVTIVGDGSGVDGRYYLDEQHWFRLRHRELRLDDRHDQERHHAKHQRRPLCTV